MQTIRMGIVGLGIMGRRYYAHTLCIGRCRGDGPLCPPSRHHRTWPVQNSCDYHLLCASGQVDAVIIATPHYSHPPIAIEALRHGLHVLVDKPLAVHVADGRRMLATHCDKNAALWRYVSGTVQAPPWYHQVHAPGGLLGDIRRVHWIVTDWFRSQAYYQSSAWRATWKGEGGGLLINQCPHHLDLLQWFVGLPRRVTAHIGLGSITRLRWKTRSRRFWNIPMAPLGIYRCTGEAPGTNRLEIAGEKGKLVLEQGKLTLFENAIETSIFSRTTRELFARPPCQAREILVAGEEDHIGVLTNFRDAILHVGAVASASERGLGPLNWATPCVIGLLSRSVDIPLDAECMEQELSRLASVG